MKNIADAIFFTPDVFHERISEGQTIIKRQKIAPESWRVVSSSSSSHTHVKVRNVKQVYACKPVNGSRLDNEDPTSFWNSLGYKVK